ncbi:MAG: regulatory protein RecX [Chloroflexota bacterium]
MKWQDKKAVQVELDFNSDIIRIIVKLIPLRKSPNYRAVFHTGEIFNISPDLVLKHSLAQGAELTPVEFKKIYKEQRIIDAKQAAHFFAAYKPRTKAEVRKKMLGKGFDEEIADIAVEFLINFNLLDDERYAINFLNEKMQLKGISKFKLENELYKRGVHKDLAKKVIAEHFPDEGEREAAMRLAEKKLRSLHSKPPDKRRDSLIAFLQRQGFRWDLIKSIIEELFPGDYEERF